MPRYIDADELQRVVEEVQDLRIVKDLSVTERLSLVAAFTSLYTMLRYIKPSDVEPVRHGHWEKIVCMAPPEYHGKNVCSLCKTRALERNHREELSDFCPNYYGKRMLPFNFKKTLVHELLHIKFALFDGYGELQDRYLHQMIEEFAKILTEDKK